MKIKFIRECRDKNNGTRYQIGQELVFPVARAKEILETGYAVLVSEEEPKEDVEEVKEVAKPKSKKGTLKRKAANK